MELLNTLMLGSKSLAIASKTNKFVNKIDIYPSNFMLCLRTTLNIPFKTSIPCKSFKSVVLTIENIS